MLPGTVQNTVIRALEESSGKKAVTDFGICINPEFLREGSSLKDYYAPPFTLIGADDENTIEAVRTGARPRHLPADEEAALDLCFELLHTHGVSDATWNDALAQFGEQGAVELTTLVGYFVMVSWLMNVARTPAQASAQGAPLEAFPL